MDFQEVDKSTLNPAKAQRVEQWMRNFGEEVKLVEHEFKKHLQGKPLRDHYQIKIDNEIGYISIEVLKREELPIEIIDALTVAFLRAKPRFKSTDEI